MSLVAGYITNRLWLSESTLCVIVGAVMSPLIETAVGSAVFDTGAREVLLQTARITLGIAVMGVALRLPGGWFKANGKQMALILLAGMPLMWLTGALISGLTLGLALVPALLAGAVLAPTDPVISFAIIGGKVADENVRERVRNLLSAESGANDGLALLFVMLPILLLSHSTDTAFAEWLTHVLLWEIVGAAALGALIGHVAGRIFRWAKSQPDAEHQSLLAVGVALAISVLFAVRLLGADGILAVFVSGLFFQRHIFELETRQEQLQGAIARFFDLPVFVLFGAILPWKEWYEQGWMLLLAAVAIVVLRRLPWWRAFGWLAPNLDTRERTFTGWFGPIGVAAVYYALLSEQRTGIELLWPLTSLAVCISVLLHGMSATPLAKLLGRTATRPAEQAQKPSSARQESTAGR